jgi:hypothetical protein
VVVVSVVVDDSVGAVGAAGADVVGLLAVPAPLGPAVAAAGSADTAAGSADTAAGSAVAAG